MAQDDVSVSFRADRGDWDVTVSIDGGDTFWQVDQLAAYLDNRPWIGEPSPNEYRADFVRRRLAELKRRIAADSSAHTTLSQIGDEWMSWRFGIPIPDGGFPRAVSADG